MPSAGDFETWELLGRNAYGAVYRGVQFSLKRDVAIFELDAGLRKEAEHSPRFWDDVTQIAQLTDDALVPVFAIDRKLGWIVMELMSGHCGQLLDKPLSVEVARSILRQGLAGLRRLHEAGRTHGDLRPATLLIHRSGRVKLSFALGAAMTGGLPYQRREMKYIAPELVSPALGEFGPRADLYCLGFSVLELLLGPKFATRFAGVGNESEADNRTAWMRWHADEAARLPNVEELVPGAAGPLGVVLDRLLKKRSADRFASAEEALALLAEAPLVPVIAPGSAADGSAGGAALVGEVDKLLDPSSRYDVVAPASSGGAAGASASASSQPRKQVAAPSKGAAANVKNKKSQLPAILVGLGFAAIVGWIVLSDSRKSGPAVDDAASKVPALSEPPPKEVPKPAAVVNQPPVLTLPAEQTITAESPFRTTIKAVDPDVPPNVVRYRLVDGPSGALLDAATGVFAWTPPAIDAPQRVELNVVAEDDATPKQSAAGKFVLQIIPRNKPPTIDPIADAVVELPLDPEIDVPAVSLRVRATDPDDPGGLPRFVLVEPALPGAKLDARTGRFTFTPPDAALLKPGSYPVAIEVFDQGSIPASTKAEFKIIVKSTAP
ncbi:MAG: putative Ig domain-containing protein [Planctomycetia bacterium]|nr:putative Ig domain-containing protein [Planctomycetia bacterium]